MLAVDLGYYSTVAKSNESNLYMPSLVAPAGEVEEGFDYADYRVTVEYYTGQKEEYLVGEAAKFGGYLTSFTLDRDKWGQGFNDILLLTAAAIMNNKPGHLELGLPRSVYKSQKDYVTNHVRDLKAWVSVNGQKAVPVSFYSIHIFPQGPAMIFGEKDLPEGIILYADLGFLTIIPGAVQVTSSKISPINTGGEPLELGMHTFHKRVQELHRTELGVPLNPAKVPDVILDGKTKIKGKYVDFTEKITEARIKTSREIANTLLAQWAPIIDEADHIILGGGGALDMTHPSMGDDRLNLLLPNCTVCEKPGEATVRGLMAVGKQVTEE